MKINPGFHSPAVTRFLTNLGDIFRLLEFHGKIAGTKVGYKHNVEVLHKSAIVLLVACWEAYLEDLATLAFDLLLAHASTPNVFPRRVLTRASKGLRADPDETMVWNLAEKGWRQVLLAHKQDVLDRIIGKFNTPKAGQVNELFEELLGLPRVSAQWHWKKMTVQRAEEKLNGLVELRGSIAHRVSASRTVHKKDVLFYITFISYLAAITHNRARDHVLSLTNKASIQINGRDWDSLTYSGVG